MAAQNLTILDEADWREPMKTLVSAIATALVILLGADVAHAGGADWLLKIHYKYWIDLIVLLLILNLVCCWWRKR